MRMNGKSASANNVQHLFINLNFCQTSLFDFHWFRWQQDLSYDWEMRWFEMIDNNIPHHHLSSLIKFKYLNRNVILCLTVVVTAAIISVSHQMFLIWNKLIRHFKITLNTLWYLCEGKKILREPFVTTFFVLWGDNIIFCVHLQKCVEKMGNK